MVVTFNNNNKFMKTKILFFVTAVPFRNHRA